MTGLRIDLANPNTFESPKEYVEKHLAPVVTELHRVVNELLSPGATSAEEWGLDMVPSKAVAGDFRTFDRSLAPVTKHVVFDGSEYFSLPKEVLRSKQAKVQLTATVYTIRHGRSDDPCRFRLVDENGIAIKGSYFQSNAVEPETLSMTLSFGEYEGCIAPRLAQYYLQGCAPVTPVQPVCRRFSLAFVYI